EAGAGSGSVGSAGSPSRYSAASVLPTECSARLAQVRGPVERVLARGETFAQVRGRFGVSVADPRAATAELAAHVPLRALRAGSRYSALIEPDATLAALELDLAGSGKLELNRDHGQPWRMAWQAAQRSSELRLVQG